jgi:hypothetical protein
MDTLVMFHHKFFQGFYDTLIEKHAAEIDQQMAMLPAQILCIDYSYKACVLKLTDKQISDCPSNRFPSILAKSMVSPYSKHCTLL